MESRPTDTTRAANGPGPSWTSAEDWESRFDAYTRQRRSDDDIRSVVADPDKRPTTDTEIGADDLPALTA